MPAIMSLKKLRELHAQESKKWKAETPKESRKKPATIVASEAEHVKIKMEIDPVKLEETIKKAIVPIQKKCIVVLDEIPKKTTVAAAPAPVPVALCIARNLNGTPCKCKAKLGKFCAKHSR